MTSETVNGANRVRELTAKPSQGVYSLSRFVHPRFGPIKCIRTIRAVEKDEELTVAYGYDHNPVGQNGPEAPEWYQLELKAFQAAQQK